jgi:hypothetical protein
MKNFITFITDTIFCLFFKLFNKVFNLDFVLLSHQFNTQDTQDADSFYVFSSVGNK